MGSEIVVAVVRHRVLGFTLAPYFVSRLSDAVIEILGRVTPLTIERLNDLTAELKGLIDILDSISEQRLARNFARGKSVKAFWDGLSAEMLKSHVRPFVDKKICEALALIPKASVRVFLRPDKYQTVNVSDALDLAPVFKSRPKFFFTLADSGELLYTLKVSDGANDVSLFHSRLIELSSNPAVFVSGHTIYSVPDVHFAKFRPFDASQRIRVDSKIVDSYMSKFVLGCVRTYWVAAYGFVIKRRSPKFRASLRARQSVFGAVFELLFIYDGNECAALSKLRPASLSVDGDGRYTFNVIMRNSYEEGRVIDLLTRDLGLSPVGDAYAIGGRADMQDLVKWAYAHRDALSACDIGVDVDDGGRRYFVGNWELLTEVEKGADWFDLRIVVEAGQYSIPFQRFFRNISSGDNCFVLPDGGVFLIPDEWFEQWSGVIPLMSVQSDGALRLASANSANLPCAILPLAAVGPVRPPYDGVVGGSVRMRGSLRNYQSEGVSWLLTLARNSHGGILADDMGLGKTLQAIGLLTAIYNVEPVDGEQLIDGVFTRNDTGRAPSLVVAPVSLIFNWSNELKRFAPHLSVYVYGGRQAPSGATLPHILAQYHVVLTTYGHVRLYAEALSRVHFECVILDESHTVKNPSSKTYAAVSSLSASCRFNLSGTPVENSLTDLWAQMNLVNPGLLGSRAFFESCYRHPIEVKADERKLKLLKTVTRPYILRRTKEQVLGELPPISVQTVLCEMTESQREVYEREKSACRNILLDPSADSGKKRFLALQALTRLRLIANHPSLCVPDYEGGSGKAEAVIECVASVVASGHKMLVFSSFVRDMELLAALLTERGIGYDMLTGKTERRDDVVSRFESSTTVKVLFISLKAGGVGLNLVSADYVLILNPWWNPAAERQAYCRAHRMGQTRSVTVYRFISIGTIEEKIDKMQYRKTKLANDAVEADVLPSFDAKLSDDELKALLEE